MKVYRQAILALAWGALAALVLTGPVAAKPFSLSDILFGGASAGAAAIRRAAGRPLCR